MTSGPRTRLKFTENFTYSTVYIIKLPNDVFKATIPKWQFHNLFISVIFYFTTFQLNYNISRYDIKIIHLTHDFLRWKMSIQVIKRISLQFSCINNIKQAIYSIQYIELPFLFYFFNEKLVFIFKTIQKIIWLLLY